ncbi:MAG TPA: hypothetical protein VFJ90_14345 [Candidatus Didemnitutus sp.]|nr:hypothetical protein [Candidatus Didemnitutus sp.]
MPDTTQLRQQAEVTAEDVRQLLREAEQALSQGVGEAGDKYNELRDRLRAAISTGRFSLQNLRDEAVRRAQQADELVHEYPYCAIGIAAGAGALIGLLASRAIASSR